MPNGFNFLTAVRTVLGSLSVVAALAPWAIGADVHLVVDTTLPPAAERALGDLREALTAHGQRIVEAKIPPRNVTSIVVGLAESPEVVRQLKATETKVPVGREALATAWTTDMQTLVFAGGGERGLTYALRDAARGIAVTPQNEPWTRAVKTGTESPFLRVRNVSVHLFNADCEREWFFSEDFWRFYFQRLSLSRFNRCTLTFCDQTNYLCPPYAYLVDMPEFPDVKVADCTPEQRKQNGAMVRRIAELADDYAIDFDLGIWMQAPVEKWAARVAVTGLPQGMELAKYCALGLQRVLEACPSVDGIQLRMNAEAGVPEDEQTEFYRPMFKAMAAVQAKRDFAPPYRLELRYKGLKQETIDAAAAEKLGVTVSTKFWAEHFGLPYHPTVVDSHYAKDRYSFGTMLRKPRNYRVTYQLWNVGSQRLTLWGDPEYAARFAKSCTVGDGEGFEVFAPLTNKGYGNKPGAWQVIKNPDYRVGRWEQERYWAFYLAFGRMSYNPEATLDFWHREFRHRFAKAAADVERAYHAASQVLPLVTAALLPSASEWYWWPEMDTGGNLRDYSHIQSSDPGMFLAMRPWAKTTNWRWEEWDVTPAYTDEVFQGKSSGRTDPLEVVAQLRTTSGYIRFACDNAKENGPPDDAEWRMTVTDMQLLAGLAEYHSQKMESAARYAVFEEANEDYRADGKLMRSAWQKIVAATDGIYHDDLVFGVAPDSNRSKQGHHHSGHWRDRLSEIDADDCTTKVRSDKPDANDRSINALNNWEIFFGGKASAYDVRHTPLTTVRPGKPIVIALTTARIEPHSNDRLAKGPRTASVRIRPLDQTQPWKDYPMTVGEETESSMVWSVSIPSEAFDGRFNLQYYFVCTHDKVMPKLSPDWRKGQPFYVVPVEAAK